MIKTDVLIIGGGITGLSTAAFLDRDYLILEASDEVGGYCKTTIRGEFVWDHSGHFFHFRNPEIKDWIMEKMESKMVSVRKITDIHYKNRIIDFPFQHNIHQLPKEEMIQCLKDAYLASLNNANTTSFKNWIKSTVGDAICEKFLIPYNEKLYACDLDRLDHEAMGRFFPASINFVDLLDKISNNVQSNSYNDYFIYPTGGSIEFVNSITRRLDPDKIHLNTRVLSIDVKQKIAYTDVGEYHFSELVSTLPFNKLLELSEIHWPTYIANYRKESLSANKVKVFNMGFDKGTEIKTHWRYFPGDEVFYRVGFYNNILDTNKMSLYVEIGAGGDSPLEDHKIILERVINDLKKTGIITDQQLIEYQYLEMNPAYVHITKESNRIYEEWCKLYNPLGINSIGRYGSWTYCSIEDNIIQAKNLSKKLAK